jgi:FkbM family methyltransferase
MKIKEIDFDKIDTELYSKDNIIYGAGYNGKLLYEKLKDKKVPIVAFYDDDRTRWNEEYCNVKIMSLDSFSQFNKDTTNIIISSMYISQIVKKLDKLEFDNIYTALDELLKKDTDDFNFSKYKNDSSYNDKLNNLISISNDAKTKQYYEVIKKSITEGKATKDIINLCCGEKQYFLKCFSGKLDGLNFIDAGAFTGDTIREMVNDGIHPKAVYCFEADRNNYDKLGKYKTEVSRDFELICENKALWDTKTKLGMKFSNYNARIDMDCKEAVVDTVTIDEYFENIKVGFVKMDIEGAEQKALKGGMRVIKRDRPILAISIYHGLEDMVEIPNMFMKELPDYNYIVRHHSYTYSETVLYGVPCELNIF